MASGSVPVEQQIAIARAQIAKLERRRDMHREGVTELKTAIGELERVQQICDEHKSVFPSYDLAMLRLLRYSLGPAELSLEETESDIAQIESLLERVESPIARATLIPPSGQTPRPISKPKNFGR